MSYCNNSPKPNQLFVKQRKAPCCVQCGSTNVATNENKIKYGYAEAPLVIYYICDTCGHEDMRVDIKTINVYI